MCSDKISWICVQYVAGYHEDIAEDINVKRNMNLQGCMQGRVVRQSLGKSFKNAETNLKSMLL